MDLPDSESRPVLHVIVVGFHHKKGCQVEFSYPPLDPGGSVDSHQVPPVWKYLPSLALPDGAHNCVKDTVFFHLPSRDDSRSTVYGVSCYRQIDANELLNRAADITRNTVQKSVCVLSKLPLYGLIRAKLELITHAYFKEKDFSKVDLLEQTYNNLNASLTESLVRGSQVVLGLSGREVVQQFKHKVMILFKLILLERRVLFFSSPVHPVCSTMLAILSLFPGMLERGLKESAGTPTSQQLSPTLKVTSVGPESSEDYLEVHYKDLFSATKSDLVGQHLETPRDAMDQSCSSDRSCDQGSESYDDCQCDADDSGIARDLRYHEHGSDHANSNSVHEFERNVHSKDDAYSNRKTRSNSEPHKPKPYLKVTEKKKPRLREGKSPDGVRPTHVELIQSSEKLFSNDSILKRYIRDRSNSAPADYVPNTHAENIQRCHSVKEDGGVDFGTEANLDDLLESEECFNWVEDNLLLEINDVLDQSQDSGSPDRELHDATTGTPTHEPSYKTYLSSSSREPGRNDASDDADSNIAPIHRSAKRSNSLHRQDSRGSAGSRGSSCSNASAGSANRDKVPVVRYAKKDGARIEMEDLRNDLPSGIETDEYGFPLVVFTKGVLCHPYLCLQYYDLLHDVNVRGFVIGASNMLFCQKHHLLDAVVQVSEVRVDIQDAELRKQLTLTTADLRFADYLVKCVTEDKDSLLLNDTEWEGGDEWLRGQFRMYLITLLSTVSKGDEKLEEDFNPSFISAWKTTHNYKQWSSVSHSGFKNIGQPGHPFHGQLSMADMKLRLAHTMQNTERGKKLNAAVQQTGKVVLQTGRAVGGAFSSAKSAVSSWFTGFSKEWTPAKAEAEDGQQQNEQLDDPYSS